VPAHPEAVEAVSEILDRVGYNGIAVDLPLDGGEHLVKAYLPYDRVARVKVRQVRTALGHLQAFGLGPIGTPRLRRLDEEDWLESWKASFTPIRIGRFLIRPTWADPTEAGDGLVVELDPGMAFGTGLHPTTQQCLEALSEAELAGRSLLDVGTGSGILAIAAGKRGAGPIVATDVDELAVRAARENCERNDVTVTIALGSAADVTGTFDVVVANIVAATLQSIAAELRARLAPGGRLIVAGIVAEKEQATLDALGLQVTRRDQRDDWVSLVLA
jgi:ribosomal protein L11 methyltransferase